MNSSFVLSFRLVTLQDLDNLTLAIAKTIQPPLVLALTGDLGAGKTAFVQSLARAYGVNEGVVSPTFTLVNHYSLRDSTTLIHSDLYRLRDDQEAAELGLSDYYDDPTAIVAIEWADRFPDLVPDTAVWCRFKMAGDHRVCTLEGLSQNQWLELEKNIV